MSLTKLGRLNEVADEYVYLDGPRGPVRACMVFVCDRHYRQRADAVENPTRLLPGAKCYRVSCFRHANIWVSIEDRWGDGD